jgi:protein-S-isoprenylcysteine O-methyltransferase Ste14
VVRRDFAQRLAFAGFHAVWVALVWWLLMGGGLETAGAWLGFAWRSGDLARRAVLAVAISIYYLRVLVTQFVFLKRRLGWGEVAIVVGWLLFIYVLMTVAGGRNAEPLGWTGGIGIALFAAGSWMNTYAEYRRHVWKQRQENSGRLYTEGLFRYSRHPNYLGDLISFSGMCLIAGAWITAIVPALMLAGFVFGNIPMLEAHLREKYGAEFESYARRMWRLIPYVF